MTRAYAVVHYGPQRAQVAELWRPRAAAEAVPVVVLFHGGFWRAVYTKRLMHGLAAALVRRGLSVWNVEYRRVGLGGGGGGWPGTLEDASAAIDRLQTVDGVDLDRVAVCGHSAGGQLALWSAAGHRLPAGASESAGRERSGRGGAASSGSGPGRPPVPVRLAVSLAGVVDLGEAARLGLGRGAVQAFLGGEPDRRAERYAAASPAALHPSPVEQLLVHGTEDTVVPPAMSERYVARGEELGERVELLSIPGAGHRSLIDPRSAGWAEVEDRLARALASSSA